MSKLFEIPEKPILRAFEIKTYKKNRVVNKLMRLLSSGGVYKVSKPYINDNFVIFEIRIDSKKSELEELESLVNEITSYIPDNFTPNYQFSINKPKLGFVYSFLLTSKMNSKHFYHRIKEIRKNSIIPKTQIYS